MNKKIALMILLFFATITVFGCSPKKESIDNPIIITENSSHRELTLDEKIQEAELIVLGNVEEVLPSRWDSVDGKGPEILTSKAILEADLSIFTDTLIAAERVLKGAFDQPVIRVRSYSGQIDQVQWVDKSQVSYESGEKYLLFLKQNTGPTAELDSGAYMSINGVSAIYKVSDKNIATSIDDERDLDELITYIQKVVSESK